MFQQPLQESDRDNFGHHWQQSALMEKCAHTHIHRFRHTQMLMLPFGVQVSSRVSSSCDSFCKFYSSKNRIKRPQMKKTNDTATKSGISKNIYSFFSLSLSLEIMGLSTSKYALSNLLNSTSLLLFLSLHPRMLQLGKKLSIFLSSVVAVSFVCRLRCLAVNSSQ